VKDERYVYGAVCTWHGRIDEVKSTRGSVTVNNRRSDVDLPACPHCGGVLMEYKNRQEWDRQIEEFVRAHPELPLYREWVATLSGPCVPMNGWDWRAAYDAFAGKVQ
jgi:hypothetical protein